MTSDTGTVAMLSSSLSTSHRHSGSHDSGDGGAGPCLSVNDKDDDNDNNNNDNQDNKIIINNNNNNHEKNNNQQ